MATTNEWREFYEAVHDDLKVQEEKANYVVEEKSESSAIKKCYVQKTCETTCFRQKENDCEALKGVLKAKQNLNSCDFVVVFCQKGEVKICFFEMKTQLNSNINDEEKRKKLKLQFLHSRNFFKYLLESYNIEYDKNLVFSSESAENFVIYPKRSVFPKRSLKKREMFFTEVPLFMEKGSVNLTIDVLKGLLKCGSCDDK